MEGEQENFFTKVVNGFKSPENRNLVIGATTVFGLAVTGFVVYKSLFAEKSDQCGTCGDECACTGSCEMSGCSKCGDSCGCGMTVKCGTCGDECVCTGSCEMSDCSKCGDSCGCGMTVKCGTCGDECVCTGSCEMSGCSKCGDSCGCGKTVKCSTCGDECVCTGSCEMSDCSKCRDSCGCGKTVKCGTCEDECACIGSCEMSDCSKCGDSCACGKAVEITKCGTCGDGCPCTGNCKLSDCRKCGDSCGCSMTIQTTIKGCSNCECETHESDNKVCEKCPVAECACGDVCTCAQGENPCDPCIAKKNSTPTDITVVSIDSSKQVSSTVEALEVHQIFAVSGVRPIPTIIKIVARYCGAAVELSEDLQEVGGKNPTLVTENGELTGLAAILRYIARNSESFYGESEYERALTDSWLEWCFGNIISPSTSYLLPVEKITQGDYYAMKDASEEILSQLDELNAYLSKKTFLVGRFVTLADIVLVLSLIPLFTEVYGKKQSSKYSNVSRWMRTVVEQPIVKLYNNPEFQLLKVSSIPPNAPKN